MPSAFLASASENFWAFLTVCVSGPRTSVTKPSRSGKHLVGAGEDVLRRLQQIGDRRRVGDDFGDRAGSFSASSRSLGSLGLAPFSSMLAWPVRPARPISAWVDLVIGVSRSICGVGDGDGRIVDVDVDAPARRQP